MKNVLDLYRICIFRQYIGREFSSNRDTYTLDQMSSLGLAVEIWLFWNSLHIWLFLQKEKKSVIHKFRNVLQNISKYVNELLLSPFRSSNYSPAWHGGGEFDKSVCRAIVLIIWHLLRLDMLITLNHAYSFPLNSFVSNWMGTF